MLPRLGIRKRLLRLGITDLVNFNFGGISSTSMGTPVGDTTTAAGAATAVGPLGGHGILAQRIAPASLGKYQPTMNGRTTP